LPRAPQALSPSVAQEILPEPKQVLASVHGIRHEVSTCTQSCHPLLINHP
jgi:hypothetical protein